MKKAKAISTVAFIVGIAFLLSVLGYFLYVAFGPGLIKPSVHVIDNNAMVSNVVEQEGLTLLMASVASESGNSVQTISATVEGEYILDDDLDWTIAWKNPSAEWVNGKNLDSYVTMSVAGDTHSVTLTNLAAFGEPIIVTATSRENPSSSATCQLDYVKRVKSAVVGLGTMVMDGTNNGIMMPAITDGFINVEDDGVAAQTVVNVNVTYDIGTVAPAIEFLGTVTLTPGEAMKNGANAAFPDASASMKTSITKSAVQKQDSDFSIPEGVTNNYIEIYEYHLVINVTISDFIAGNTSHLPYLQNWMNKNLNTTGVIAPLGTAEIGYSVPFNVMYNGTVYQTTEATGNGFARTFLESVTTVSNVELDQSNVAF